MARRIKVPFSGTIEVDAELWNRSFGTGTDPAAIRADVHLYLTTNIHLGVLDEVEGTIEIKPRKP